MGCCDKIKVNSCCCCISLQVGAKIIGFLVLIGGIVNLAIDAFAILLVNAVKFEQPTTQRQYVIYYNQYPTAPIALDNDEVGPTAVDWVMAGVGVTIDLVTIAIAIVLLVGAFKRRPKLLKVFCIVALVLLVIDLVSNIIDNIVEGFDAQSDLHSYVNCLFDLYWILVIKSAYHDMKEDQAGAGGRGGQVLHRYNDNTQMHQLKPLNP